MKVTFTKQEVIEILRAHYNFSSAVEIVIDEVNETPQLDWCNVPDSWWNNFAPIDTTTEVRVKYRDGSICNALAGDFRVDWNQQCENAIVAYQIIKE